MVDTRHLTLLSDPSSETGSASAHRGRWLVVVVVAGLAAATLMVSGLAGGTGASASVVTAGANTHLIALQRAHRTRAAAAAKAPVPTATETAPPAVSTPTSVTPATTPTTTPTPTAVVTVPVTVTPTPTPVAAPVPVAAPAAVPAVASLVAEVEAAGIVPGGTWTWSIGATSECGAIPSSSGDTGCTFGAAGAARTVFSGSPTLALVAHEMANAETENDASPSLMSQVAAAEAGTSWSGIDAVATCLVAHFMGFQDEAAGTWQCPAALASTVAATIHA